MFDEMRISALSIGFIQRADIGDHADRHLPRRHAVVTHRIAQAVRQNAESPLRVVRHVGPDVEPGDVRRRRGTGNPGGKHDAGKEGNNKTETRNAPTLGSHIPGL